MSAAAKLSGKSTKLARPGGATIAPNPPTRAGRLLFIATEKIRPNPDQPRHEFDPAALQELADSIQEHGLLEPLVVQLMGKEPVLIAGERRLRAARLAGVDSLPCVVREGDDDGAVLALVENLHRRDLTPMETAEALAKLKATRELDLAALAKLAGKAKSTVSEILGLAGLPAKVKQMAGQRPERFPQRLLVELAKLSGPCAEAMATSVLGGKRTPEEMRRQLREERRPTPLPMPDRKPASADAGPEATAGPDRKAGGRAVKVRGVPVRIAADGSLHAVVWNYFPVSHTGFLSGAAHGGDPAYWTGDKLEALARERDQERAATMRDAARALKRAEPFFEQGGPLVNPIDVGLGLTAILASVVGRAWLAPENDQAKLLALAAELAHVLAELPLATRKQRDWTPEKWEARLALFQGWAPAIAKAREGDWLPLALAYRVGRHLPEVVADTLGIATYEAPPQEPWEHDPAPDTDQAAPEDSGTAHDPRAERHAVACADHAWEMVDALARLERARLRSKPHESLQTGLTVLAKAAAKALAELKAHPPVSQGGQGRH